MGVIKQDAQAGSATVCTPRAYLSCDCIDCADLKCNHCFTDACAWSQGTYTLQCDYTWGAYSTVRVPYWAYLRVITRFTFSKVQFPHWVYPRMTTFDAHILEWLHLKFHAWGWLDDMRKLEVRLHILRISRMSQRKQCIYGGGYRIAHIVAWLHMMRIS